MRTPGDAWLEWQLESRGPHITELHQRAIFFPKGFAGQLYWYSLLPFHGIIFTGMLNNIAVAAAGTADSEAATRPGPETKTTGMEFQILCPRNAADDRDAV
jgi:hypothetical protein